MHIVVVDGVDHGRVVDRLVDVWFDAELDDVGAVDGVGMMGAGGLSRPFAAVDPHPAVAADGAGSEFLHLVAGGIEDDDLAAGVDIQLVRRGIGVDRVGGWHVA